jgi:hypothetical protein
VSFFDEIHFPSKKVIEIYQLRIPVDDLICFLLERQPDIQSETALSAGPSLGRPHNPIAASGDDHESALTHFLSKTFCSLEFFGARPRSCRTEDGDFTDPLVGRKSLGRLP